MSEMGVSLKSILNVAFLRRRGVANASSGELIKPIRGEPGLLSSCLPAHLLLSDRNVLDLSIEIRAVLW